MDIKLELHTDRHVDALGNSFTLVPDQVALKSEIAPWKACFSYSG